MSLDFTQLCFCYFVASIAVIIFAHHGILFVKLEDFLLVLDGTGPNELLVSLRIGVELL